MTYLHDTFNDYGTPVSAFQCDTCGQVVTICPTPPIDQRDQWNHCMISPCPSYDPDRDVLMLTMLGAELKEQPHD